MDTKQAIGIAKKLSIDKYYKGTSYHVKVFDALSRLIKIAEDYATLKAENEGLKDCLLTRDEYIKELKRNVREWICVNCNKVYPKYPQAATSTSLICPRCGKVELVKRDSRGEVALWKDKYKAFAERVDEEKIREVLGWCYTTKENEHKEMDATLMNTIAQAICKYLRGK